MGEFLGINHYGDKSRVELRHEVERQGIGQQGDELIEQQPAYGLPLPAQQCQVDGLELPVQAAFQEAEENGGIEQATRAGGIHQQGYVALARPCQQDGYHAGQVHGEVAQQAQGEVFERYQYLAQVEVESQQQGKRKEQVVERQVPGGIFGAEVHQQRRGIVACYQIEHDHACQQQEQDGVEKRVVQAHFVRAPVAAAQLHGAGHKYGGANRLHHAGSQDGQVEQVEIDVGADIGAEVVGNEQLEHEGQPLAHHAEGRRLERAQGIGICLY